MQTSTSLKNHILRSAIDNRKKLKYTVCILSSASILPPICSLRFYTDRQFREVVFVADVSPSGCEGDYKIKSPREAPVKKFEIFTNERKYKNTNQSPDAWGKKLKSTFRLISFTFKTFHEPKMISYDVTQRSSPWYRRRCLRFPVRFNQMFFSCFVLFLGFFLCRCVFVFSHFFSHWVRCLLLTKRGQEGLGKVASDR